MESIYFTGMGFLFGSSLGSFTKVLADRGLKKQGINGRSYCPGCKTTLRWYDLLPVFSFIYLKGKCRYCHKKIGFEYIIVEILSGVLFSLLFFQLPYSVFFSKDYFKIFITVEELFFKCFSVCILIAVALTDIKKMLIPDRIILPSIVMATMYLIITTLIKVAYLFYYLNQSSTGKFLIYNIDYFRRHMFYTAEPLLYSVATAVLIGGFFYSLIIVTRGRGMGGGDVKLGSFIGLILGFPMSLIALLIAFISGSIVGVFLIVSGKKTFGQHIAFGPYLVLGAITVLLYGDKILNWYLHLSI